MAQPADATTTPARGGTLYTVDAKGKLVAHRVRPGVTDGKWTEVRGKDIAAGMKIVAGTTSPSDAAEGTDAKAANPFQNGNQQQRRGPGGF